MIPGLLLQRHGPVEPARIGDGPVDQRGDVRVLQRGEGDQQGAGEQRGDHREARVLGGRGHQHHPAVLHPGQQGILLGLGEAVDLIQEQHGGDAVQVPVIQGLLHHRAHILDPGGDRGQLHELPPGTAGDDVGDGGLAGAGRAPQDHGAGSGRAGVLPGEHPQRGAGLQSMGLPHDLLDGARAHPHRQRAAGAGGPAVRRAGGGRAGSAASGTPAGGGGRGVVVAEQGLGHGEGSAFPPVTGPRCPG
ncbi:Uncharacterised protein [Mycobacteroides abscessus subsp. abscessus]|nr:Uncharacterised protein [Mycobacteroides abscessus subsp. abscessus]